MADQPEGPKPPGIDEDARRVIRAKARRLARSPGFLPGEQEDLEQELAMLLLQRQGAFDPSRGLWRSFAATVVARCAVSLRRGRLAAKRGHGRRWLAVLDELPGPAAADAEGGMDADALLASLAPEDRELLEAAASGGVAALARRRGVAAPALRKRGRSLLARLHRLVRGEGAG